MNSLEATTRRRPLAVYLDSSDYSNLASAAADPAFRDAARWNEASARLLALREAGSVVVRFSYPLVMEAYPTEERHRPLAVGRARAMSDISGRACMRDLHGLFLEEAKALVLTGEPCPRSTGWRDDGGWHPDRFAVPSRDARSPQGTRSRRSPFAGDAGRATDLRVNGALGSMETLSHRALPRHGLLRTSPVMRRNALDAQFSAMTEMYERGQNLDEIAGEFGCSRKVVRRALEVLGRKPRPRTEPKGRRRGSLDVVYEGQPFDSLAALARHLGEGDPSGQTLRARLTRRQAKLDTLTAVDVRVTEPKDRRSAVAKTYVLEGEIFPSIVAACRAFGLGRAKVEHRLDRNWTRRQAFGIDPPPPRDRNRWKRTELVDGKALPKTEVGSYKLYEITNTRNGRFYIGITVVPLEQRLNNHFQNAKQAKRTSRFYRAIRKYGRGAFRIRLLRNDAKDFRELQQQEIAEIAARNALTDGYNVAHGGSIGTAKPVTVGIRTFPSQGAAAEAFGIDPQKFNLRMSRWGWTPEQAAEIESRPGGHRHRRITVEEVAYPSMAEAARRLGVSLAVAHGRHLRGATLDQAFGLEPLPAHFRRTGRVDVGEAVFPNMKAAAAARGLSYVAVQLRIKRGATIRQALEYDPMPSKRRGRRRGAQPEREGTPDLFG